MKGSQYSSAADAGAQPEPNKRRLKRDAWGVSASPILDAPLARSSGERNAQRQRGCFAVGGFALRQHAAVRRRDTLR